MTSIKRTKGVYVLKKFLKGFLVIFISLLVASCSGNTNTSGTGNNDGGSSEIGNGNGNGDGSQKEEPRQEMKVNDIIVKALEATESLTSYTFEFDMEQKMDMIGNEMIMKGKTVMDVVLNPLSIYQKMDMTITINGESRDMGTETYFTPEGIYASDSVTNGWLKLPDELWEGTQSSGTQKGIEDQLKLLNEFMDSITMEQESSHYVLTIKGNDVSFAKLVNALALSNVDEETFMLAGDMTIEQFEYIMHFDKTNFYPIKNEIKSVVTFSGDGESTTFYQTLTGTYSNHNKFDKIEIPDEVINSVREY